MEDLKVVLKEIQIREEYDLIDAMMRGLHESEKELFNKTDDWNVIGKNYMRHVIEMQEECDGTCIAAFVNKQPAGFIFGYIDEDDDDSRIEAYTGKDLYVSDGFVEPIFRRMGVYKQLNTALEAIYIQKGIRRMLRFTLTSNKRMQEFLAKENYQPVRFLYEKWLTDDGLGVQEIRLGPSE